MSNCNKEYKDRTGLWKHKKKCTKIHTQEVQSDSQTDLIYVIAKQQEETTELKNFLLNKKKIISSK